jgi:hypothetical protein
MFFKPTNKSKISGVLFKTSKLRVNFLNFIKLFILTLLIYTHLVKSINYLNKMEIVKQTIYYVTLRKKKQRDI